MVIRDLGPDLKPDASWYFTGSRNAKWWKITSPPTPNHCSGSPMVKGHHHYPAPQPRNCYLLHVSSPTSDPHPSPFIACFQACPPASPAETLSRYKRHVSPVTPDPAQRLARAVHSRALATAFLQAPSPHVALSSSQLQPPHPQASLPHTTAPPLVPWRRGMLCFIQHGAWHLLAAYSPWVMKSEWVLLGDRGTCSASEHCAHLVLVTSISL